MAQEPSREIPGLDPAGIAPRAALAEVARSLAAPDFAVAYKAPALVFQAPGASASAPAKASGSAAYQILTITASNSTAGDASRYADKVAFVTKRPGNPFPHMVSIGRVATNDVVVVLETVSKLHGYFLRDGERWHYPDYRSTNGSLVNGQPVEKGAKIALQDGDRLRFGSELEALFLLPRTLHEHLRKAAGPA